MPWLFYVHHMHIFGIIMLMRRVTVMLGVPQFQALTALAKAMGLSFSEVLRRAIDAYLSQQKT